jgi:hypothetical protein
MSVVSIRWHGEETTFPGRARAAAVTRPVRVSAPVPAAPAHAAGETAGPDPAAAAAAAASPGRRRQRRDYHAPASPAGAGGMGRRAAPGGSAALVTTFDPRRAGAARSAWATVTLLLAPVPFAGRAGPAPTGCSGGAYVGGGGGGGNGGGGGGVAAADDGAVVFSAADEGPRLTPAAVMQLRSGGGAGGFGFEFIMVPATGALVTRVVPGSAAELAGLRCNHVILRINSVSVAGLRAPAVRRPPISSSLPLLAPYPRQALSVVLHAT